ncbi:hypothetical protein HBI12_080990 [Parastagonospora nodorum]|nr:hypothetical protein HBI12_080990 [Parastagonospora nodorum]
MESTGEFATIGVCHLFRLPGELRNYIYEYALTEERPLKVERRSNDTAFKCYKQPLAQAGGHHEMGAFSKSPTDTLVEVNQLRFVNKELHAETRALALRYNNLAFNSIGDANEFLKNCALSQQAHLHTLTIHCTRISGHGNPPAMKSIVQFCRAHPGATVRIKHSCNNPNVPISLMRIASREYRMRGTHKLLNAIFAPGCGQREAHIESFEAKLKGAKIRSPPRNFRFFPCITSFDERTFRAGIEEDDELLWWLAYGYIQGGNDSLVRLMKQVIEHGI